MLDLLISVKRDWFIFQEGVNAKTVQEYLKKLMEFKATFKSQGWDASRYLFYSHELYEKIMTAASQEIKLCEFYLNYLTRRTEADFNKWVFTPKDKLPADTFERNRKHTWTKTNGKVQATITKDETGKMVKFTLDFRNDNTYLEFTNYDDAKENGVKSAFAKSGESQRQKLWQFKVEVDEFMGKHQFPLWWVEENRNVRNPFEEVRQTELLKKLLFTNGNGEANSMGLLQTESA